jgi:hypothetical protein
MWKYALYTVVIIAILLTAFGCGNSHKIQAGLNSEFVLSIGQSASITGEDLEITFKDVTGDSRCPSNVTCIWAGEVTCIIELKQAGSSSRMALNDSGLTTEYSKEAYKGYQLAFKVTPYPVAGTEILLDAYRLHLIVSK